MTFSDTNLTERLKKGDLEAFDMIYQIYAGKLYSFGMRYLKSSADAEELVQTVFLKVWENHKKIDATLSFKSYLFTIAYNDILKLFRKKSYLQKYVAEIQYNNSVPSSSTEEGLEYQSLLDQVQAMVEGLPANQKKAFILSKIEGKSSKDVASMLGLSPGTVDNYISETLKMIRAKLNRETLQAVLFISLFLF